MDIVSKHILEQLDYFLLEEDESFIKAYEAMNSTLKFKCKPVLNYIHLVLKKFQATVKDELSCFHIHIEKFLDDETKLIIAEFLIITYFQKYISSDGHLTVNEELTKKISSLEKATRSDLQVPLKVSTIQLKKIFHDRHVKKELLKAYKTLPNTSTLEPKVIWNNQIFISDNLKDIFRSRPFITQIESLGSLNSYVVTNTNQLNQIKNIKIGPIHFLKNIDGVILFDCENSVKRFSEFNFDFLTNLNLNHNTSFKYLIFLTFGESLPSVNDLKKEVDLIKTRFRVPSGSSYIIRSSEINHLTDEPNRRPGLKIDFYGPVDITSWNTLILETKLIELYELQSIKLMNLYSLVFTDDIKDYVLKEIFSNPNSNLLTDETKFTISKLAPDELLSIKNALSESLDSIIRSEWLKTVKKHIGAKRLLIISDAALKDLDLQNKIRITLDIHRSVKLISWYELELPADDNLGILAFRDHGRFPYSFSPNVVETESFDATDSTALFLRCFFENKFHWSRYNLDKESYNLMSHPIRTENFSWKGLFNLVRLGRPNISNITNWELEHDYANSQNRLVCKVKFKTIKQPKLFAPSDLFIVKNNQDGRLTAERITDLVRLDLKDNTLYAQQLEQIEEGINIYEKMFDSRLQDEELNSIKDKFDIPETETGTLWKLLLKRKSVEIGVELLYNDLKEHFLSLNLKCVSFFHFKNAWIEPESQILTPLSKKVFRTLCDYLKLPDSYYLIMQRVRNSSKEATRQSTIQMNYLLKDLFNDGCFDENASPKDILKRNETKYKKNHPLDDIGIDQNHLVENLVALVELIKPELYLTEVESIENITP